MYHRVDRVFLSTLSLRRATLRVVDGSKSSIISIHALLAESDRNVANSQSQKHISIHALLAESDVNSIRLIKHIGGFLSTLSLRRATLPVSASINCAAYFYPRSPCGERPPLTSSAKTILAISIHALLAESDVHYDNYNLHCVISIHALLAESD